MYTAVGNPNLKNNFGSRVTSYYPSGDFHRGICPVSAPWLWPWPWDGQTDGQTEMVRQ